MPSMTSNKRLLRDLERTGTSIKSMPSATGRLSFMCTWTGASIYFFKKGCSFSGIVAENTNISSFSGI